MGKHIFDKKEFGKCIVEITKGKNRPEITIQVENDLFSPKKMGVMKLDYSSIVEKGIVFSEVLKFGKMKIGAFGWERKVFEEVKKDYGEINQSILEEKEQAKIKAKEDRMKALEEGAEFEIYYEQGEGLQGYTAYGMEAEILEGLDAGEYVSGWGFCIDKELIHDGKLTLADIKAKNEEKEAKAAEKAAEKEKVFALAKETGKPQLLKTYLTECDGTEIDCSHDTITVWAMPDGSTEEHRQHNA